MTSPLALDAFLAELLDPAKIMTHVPYALLVISMMMRDMGWLRAIAISAGLIRIINRAFFDQDFIVVFWEVLLVGVNAGQLLVLWYYARRARFSEDEKIVLGSMSPDVSRRTVRRLLRLGSWQTVEPGAVMIEEGNAVASLSFIVNGVAQVERAGRIVAVCGPGDFLGEMSFITGAAANATVRVVKPVRALVFAQSELRHSLRNDEELRRAIDSSLNRNFAVKLAKTTAGAEPG